MHVRLEGRSLNEYLKVKVKVKAKRKKVQDMTPLLMEEATVVMKMETILWTWR